MNEVENPVQKLWQDQPVEGIKMSVEEIRRRAGKFESRIRRRNLREYVGSLIAAGLLVYFFATAHDWLQRVADVLFIAAMLWIVVALHRKGSAKSLPEGIDTLSGLRFYRAELERQYRVVKDVWWWYLAPMVPGFVVFTLGYAWMHPHPAGWVKIALMDVGVTALFIWVWRMNQKAARCLEKMIAELKAAE